jgi:4-hydroxybenzoate polyprenyltransferase
LDLSVFSSLKSHYRKEVGYLTLLTDSSPLGKQNFLACYQKARREALSAKNIKNGWKATGLWPKSMAKPLMSPLLLENSNRAKETPQQALQSLPGGSEVDWNGGASPTVWSTPKKSTELKAQAAEFQKLQDQGCLTQRLLFRKIAKGFEEQESIIASHELRIQSLEVQLEKARPKKRRKVRTSPNSKFADIRAIQQTQREVNREDIEEEALDIASLSDSTLDCIEVE